MPPSRQPAPTRRTTTRTPARTPVKRLGAAVPGDADAENATIGKMYLNGRPNQSLSIKGYTKTINMLNLPSTQAVRKPWEETAHPHPIKGGEDATTAAVQSKKPTGTPPPLTVNVAGLDYNTWGAGHPPDTSGAVGPKNFVQTVNTSIGVYDKSGNQLNAFTFNTFFGQFHTGTPCDNQNGGDPQAIFDQPANRWIIADLSYPGRPVLLLHGGLERAEHHDEASKWTMYPYVASQTD